MGRRLGPEEAMTIAVLQHRGLSKRAIARALGVTEGAVRYHLRQGPPDERVDGRAKSFLAEQVSEAIGVWMRSDSDRGRNLAELHEFLVAEYGYTGSYKSVQRYVRSAYPPPPIRTRRRVETPPGAQAQVDWAHFPDVMIGGERVDLYAFYLVLSYSRLDVVIWSTRKDELAWLAVHNQALRRLGGVPAVLRVDNEKTAVSVGAGAWGEINPTYAAYARAVRFHVDATRPRSPGDKGKVERRILDGRRRDPRRRCWSSLEELQAWSDAQSDARALRQICPATGLSVRETFEREERGRLGELPILPEPFDVVATREVSIDATVAFEGRTYTVPFLFVGRTVEIRGCARAVQIWHAGSVIAEHERRTRQRLIIDPAHYDGPGDARVAAPAPLGRMGKRLAEIAAMVPERRPLDLYVALAEAAR